MSIRDTRAGFTQSRFNEDAMNLVALEITALAVAVGIGKSSWWWGGGRFIGCAMVLAIPGLNALFALALSAAWAGVGFAIGMAVNQNGANYVIAAIAGLASLGCHLGAIEWATDIGAKD